MTAEPSGVWPRWGEEQSRRVRNLADTVGGLLEAADLIGRAEAVLQPAQHAQARLAVTLEVEHHVDQVLQHARASDVAVLGDVADQQDRQVRRLRQACQRGCDRAGLSHTASDAFHAGRLHRLDRVHDEQIGFDLVDMAEQDIQVRFRRQEQAVLQSSGAFSAAADLGSGLFCGHVQRGARFTVGTVGTGGSPFRRHLQQQRRLSHARLAGEQDHRSGDDAAAEDAVELADARR